MVVSIQLLSKAGDSPYILTMINQDGVDGLN